MHTTVLWIGLSLASKRRGGCSLSGASDDGGEGDFSIKRRLMVSQAAGVLMAAMLPGVAQAAADRSAATGRIGRPLAAGLIASALHPIIGRSVPRDKRDGRNRA